jgi:hypothetical protein
MNLRLNIDKKEYWIVTLLLFIYVGLRLSDILCVGSFHTLILPLNLFYYAKTLFIGVNINPEIARTVISPSTASLIYPPGVYILSELLGSIKNAFYFLFTIQILVPLYCYKLLRTVAPVLFSFCAAIVIAHFCTSANTWYPDYIIQPLMIGVIFYMVSATDKCRQTHLFSIGIVCGLIIILKHNIGIFFAILCGTILFIRSLNFHQDVNKTSFFGYFLFFGFILFGFIFMSRLIYVDEVIFYLLPYFIFWSLLIREYYSGNISFNVSGFFKNSATFSLATIIFPVAIFIWFGSVIGYKEYWYSLFGMGLSFLEIWDPGIFGILNSYVSFQGWWTGSVLFILASITGPFLVNIIAIGIMCVLSFQNERFKKENIVTIAIGIMAIFILFPLEDHKISVTKSFIYLYVAVFFLKELPPQWWRNIAYLLLFMIIPVTFVYVKSNLFTVINTTTEMGTKKMQELISLPIQKNISSELTEQLKIMKRTINDQPYFILVSSARNIMALRILYDNKSIQHYVRFDEAMLTYEVTKDIEKILRNIPYVVISSEDYKEYLSNVGVNNALNQLIEYVDKSFFVVDEYHESSNDLATRHIDGFLILKSN